MSKKTFILDTNVVLSDAESIFKFQDNEVVIPQPVLIELDTKKREQNEIGRNARAFSRYIDELRLKGNLLQGVEVNDKGGILKIITYNLGFERFLPYQDMKIKDNMILACALSIPNTPDTDVILISNDTNMRINADIFGVKAESYKNNKIVNDEFYTGDGVIYVDQQMIERVYANGKLLLSEVLGLSQANLMNGLEETVLGLSVEPYPNQFFTIKNVGVNKQSALVRYDSVMEEFRLLPQDMKTFDIMPRNTEQQFALSLLKDDSLSLVSIQSKAGAGKTILSLAAGLDAVLNRQQYKKIMLFKPIISMDNANELGFLPGSLLEKLSPWMASYGDNISYIMSNYTNDEKPRKKATKKEIEVYNEKQQGKTNPILELMELGLLEMGSLEHLRGRSISDCYLIVDETQNTSANSLKTIITRAGENTKVVLLGDINQIDTPYLDDTNNGLSICIDKMKGQNLYGHITLRKSERSKLAELAANIL